MNWEKLDWAALDRLRAGFIGGEAARGPYWTSFSDLEAYDLTYGERIGWKWDAVLAELRLRGWELPSGREKLRILDWGCGSGVAGRRVIAEWGAARFSTLYLWDHSPLALRFAQEHARRAFPDLSVEPWMDGNSPVDVLVVSHVFNELSADAQDALRARIRSCGALLWIEPGTSEVAKTLQGWRDELLSEFRIVAPCPHLAGCGLQVPGNERHWCHHFAHPPSGVYADRDWVKFGQRAGIDLRSLPYSFLVLDRITDAAPPPPDLARVIGRPEHFKPYARVLSCERPGVFETTISRRKLPELYKHLDRTRGPLLYRWQREENQVIRGSPAFPESLP